MMTTAFLFSGQGAQFPGMGKDLYQDFSEIKNTFDYFSDLLGFCIKTVCFKYSQRELTESKNAQIAICVLSLSILNVLKAEGISSRITAGHSLGLFTAIASAGGFSFDHCAKLVLKRGELFSECIAENKGKMLAVIGLPLDIVQRACSQYKEGIVAVSTINTPDKIILGGELKAVDELGRKLLEQGAKRIVPLNVSGAFHTSLMSEAENKFKKFLNEVNFEIPSMPILANSDGRLMQDPETIKQELFSHITTPVHWVKTVAQLVEQQVTHCIEIGPGKTLKGFFLEMGAPITCFTTGTSHSLQLLIKELKTCKPQSLQV